VVWVAWAAWVSKKKSLFSRRIVEGRPAKA